MEKKKLFIILGVAGVIILMGVLLFFLTRGEEQEEEPPIEVETTKTISESGTVLSDETFEEVIITVDVGDGEVTLTNMTIGTLIIQGGGKESIKIEDSKIDKIVSERDDDLGVRILFVGNNEVGEIEIRYYTILESGDETNEIKKIVVQSPVDKLTILELREIKTALLELRTEAELVKMGETIITEVIDHNKVTVKFNSDGGTEIADVEIKKGEKVEKPANPTKSGYIFVEWQLNGEAFDFDEPVTENITLIAIYKERTTTGPGPGPGPGPDPGPDPAPTETYTFETEAMVGTPALKVTVYRNGTPVTVSEVLDDSNNTLGEMTDAGYVTVDSSIIQYIAKAKLANGTIVELD